MRKTVLSLLILLSPLCLRAQTAEQEILQQTVLSGSNYLAYRGPQKALTAAPKGYEPFYISHYGRHGSRYLIGDDDYDWPLEQFTTAFEKNKLTPLGRDVMERLQKIREESRKRDGELTELGAEQHRQIARRMYNRFPQVFKGDAPVDAKSTIVIRCILSMENELQELIRCNPQLRITHDASYHDMFYMNQPDKKLDEKKMPQRAKVALDEFNKQYPVGDRVLNNLFNDPDYIHYDVNGEKLISVLFKLASNLQSSELRKEITLYDLFTPQELYNLWQRANAWWYVTYGPSPLSGGVQPFSQRNLLRNIIQQADSCMQLPQPGATLRFGHETMVMPLTCLLGLNGYDRQIEDLNRVNAEGWHNFDIFPMGANIQLIFYRNTKKGGPVLVKILLNEDETTLPMADQSRAPYYIWEDVRQYYLNKLNSYKEEE
ncbi:MAG: histidine-type phosphatase [Prevotella sp.]|nr:histidine-type phosphatase [Prevotella sp.]